VPTPEENTYIEAFHSILQRKLIERFEFSSFYEANRHLQHYMQWSMSANTENSVE